MARIRNSRSTDVCGNFSLSSVSEVKRSVWTISCMEGNDKIFTIYRFTIYDLLPCGRQAYGHKKHFFTAKVEKCKVC